MKNTFFPEAAVDFINRDLSFGYHENRNGHFQMLLFGLFIASF